MRAIRSAIGDRFQVTIRGSIFDVFRQATASRADSPAPTFALLENELASR
ncbi:hypothetical protein WDZ92_13010 [Nostoc sp. NIES-2111]